MDQLFEFIRENLLLSGMFFVVLAAWLTWEVARLARKWREVGTLEAVRLINQDALVLDVSNSADHAKGHIIGALHMPPSRIEAGNQQLLKYREQPVLVYCKNNQVAPQMANKLVGLGFQQVNVLAGGMAQWQADSQPVSRAKGSGKKKDKKDKAGKKARKVEQDTTHNEASTDNTPADTGQAETQNNDKI
ncbi:MAG: rhodanese-like domain-containing protein [Wenzhouxiangella sp.]